MLTDIFSKNAPILIIFFFVVDVGKITLTKWSRSITFLNPHSVNLSVCVLNILFGYNFRKNRTMARKFWCVFELHRFALCMRNWCCVVHRSFYEALQIFQSINIFCSLLMTQTGTKFWYVFKLHRSDLHTKINHRIQHIFFYRALQKIWIQ